MAGGIALVCLCSFLVYTAYRDATRPPPDQPYISPLAKIASGVGLLDIGIPPALLATQTNVEDLVQQLYSRGWSRTAARLARQNPGNESQSPVFIRLARDIGDGRLFWANRAPLDPPEEFWIREIPPYYGGEKRYALLKAWPADDASPLRLMQWIVFLAKRPISQTESDFVDMLCGILPPPVASGMRCLLKPLAESSPLSTLYAAVILPKRGTPEPVIWDNIGNLIGCGFNWAAVRPLADLLPEAWLPKLLPLAQPEYDEELILEILKKTDAPVATNSLDLLIALTPEEFSRVAGGARRPLLLRRHMVPEISTLIGSEAAMLILRGRRPPPFEEGGLFGVREDGKTPLAGLIPHQPTEGKTGMHE